MNRRALALVPMEAARAAGLRYVSDAEPGIRRRRVGHGFRYFDADGRVIRDPDTLARIRALVIPPAWQEVWISAREDGHVQATGRDARRRKQYRYHPGWRAVRDESKYGRLADFAAALPRIRRRVTRDLGQPGLPREKVLATVVRLLERTFIRIGNAEYARENESFGLTTLRERQVQVDGARLRFRFRGKSGVPHEVALTDRRLARIVQRMQELPGEELFQYVDDEGMTRPIGSADVNDYLRSIAGADFTSKDFRTWAGTLLCARALRALPPPASATAGRRHVAQAIEAAAQRLRNTRAVCRKCYVHPAVIESYLAGYLHEAMIGRSEEAALIRLLKARRRNGARAPQARRLRLSRRGRTAHAQTHHHGRALHAGASGLRP